MSTEAEYVQLHGRLGDAVTTLIHERDDLRAEVARLQGDYNETVHINDVLTQERDRARAEVTRLTAALMPFVTAFQQRRERYAVRYQDHDLGRAKFDTMPDDWKMDGAVFNMGDFRRASQAVTDAGQKGK